MGVYFLSYISRSVAAVEVMILLSNSLPAEANGPWIVDGAFTSAELWDLISQFENRVASPAVVPGFIHYRTQLIVAKWRVR